MLGLLSVLWMTWSCLLLHMLPFLSEVFFRSALFIQVCLLSHSFVLLNMGRDKEKFRRWLSWFWPRIGLIFCSSHEEVEPGDPWAWALGRSEQTQQLERMVIPEVFGKKYMWRLEDNPWGSGVGGTKDPSPAPTQMKKRHWQLLNWFKVPEKWLALKGSFFWHPDCQCCVGCSKWKSFHIRPLM